MNEYLTEQEQNILNSIDQLSKDLYRLPSNTLLQSEKTKFMRKLSDLSIVADSIMERITTERIRDNVII